MLHRHGNASYPAGTMSGPAPLLLAPFRAPLEVPLGVDAPLAGEPFADEPFSATPGEPLITEPFMDGLAPLAWASAPLL